MKSLNTKDKEFYQRHLILDGFGISAQQTLKSSSVLVVGAGGLGCPALQYLVSAGVGRVGIIDDDVVEMSNLQRQTLYFADDLGKSKAETAAKKLAQHNPNVVIEPHCQRLKQQNITKIFDMYDVVVDGSDNFETRYLVNDACVILNKPLVFGAIFKFSGQLSVFNFKNGPTYRCLFPNPPSAEALPPCEEAGVLGVLPGIIGSMQALEAIKIITGIGEVMSGRVLLFDALGQKFNELKLSPVKKNQEIEVIEEMDPLTFCNHSEHSEVPEIIELSPRDFLEMYNSNPHINVIDVRESWERDIEHIQPSLHIPLGDFFDSTVADALPDELSENIVIYCKAGVRSFDACRVLMELGYKKIYNLEGGMLRWNSESMPLII